MVERLKPQLIIWDVEGYSGNRPQIPPDICSMAGLEKTTVVPLAAEGHRRALKNQGYESFLSKPVEVSQLAEVIAKLPAIAH